MNAQFEFNESSREISFPCLRLKQPIGEFFVGVLQWSVLCDIADFDVRRVLEEKRDVEKYLGIQRPLSPARVKDLNKYVNFVDATFPTSTIIAVDSRSAKFDDNQNRMTLSNVIEDSDGEKILYKRIARVIDGQHRIAGLRTFLGEDFDIGVTIFVGSDIADQAQVFSTVNLRQTKVSKSLAYDLFELARSRSPHKTCHDIAITLNSDKDSPLFHRIKRLGVSTPGRFQETINQATFVESLMKLLSKDPSHDRDQLLRKRKLPPVDADELERVPFRNLFVEERDFEITDLVWNFFEAVETRWPEAWNDMGKGIMLNKTNGFRGLMRAFPKIYRYITAPGEMVSSSQFKKQLRRVDIDDSAFTVENYPPGSTGEGRLYNDLVNKIIPSD